jgi:hypothetical protein
VAAQPARAPIATASSVMNNHRPLSPISEHPIRYPSPAAPRRTRRSLPRSRRRRPRRNIGLQCGVVEAVGRDGLRRVGPAFVDKALMVDVMLMQALMRAVPDHAALLIVGEIDQLY